MSEPNETAALRRRVEELEAERRRLAELVGEPDPDKLEHKLRNVLNELNLLRRTAALDDD